MRWGAKGTTLLRGEEYLDAEGKSWGQMVAWGGKGREDVMGGGII